LVVTLYPGQLKEVKRLALEEDRNISELVREVLREYLILKAARFNKILRLLY